MKFPVELFRAVADEVDSAADLRSIRAATRMLHSVATPRAFRTLRVSDSLKSAEGFMNLLQAEGIAGYVVEVVFHDVYSEAFDPIEEAAIAQLETVFGMLGSLPSLSTLMLSLHPVHNEYVLGGDLKPSSRLLMQFAIIRGLCGASDKLHLTSFSILNMSPYNPRDGFYETPSFTRLFLSLQMLHISIATDQSHEGSFPVGPMMLFWNNTVQPRIFNPSAGFVQTLTSLTLEADIDIGEFPRFSFAKLNYPQLSSLSLTCFMFSEVSDLEDFIVRHKATLRSLKLKHCTIPFFEGEEPSRYWVQIWNRFAEELTSLEELVVEPKMDTAPERVLNYAYYAYFDPSWGYNSHSEEVPADEGDAEALEAFEAVVKFRRP